MNGRIPSALSSASVSQPGPLSADAEFRRLLASPRARREIAAAYLAHAEQGLLYLGRQSAICRDYPQHIHPLGRSGRVIEEVRRSLALAEALLAPLARRGTQNLRTRSARGGAISRAEARVIPTTTRDRTSGRRHGRRVFQGAPALAPTNVR